MLIMWIAAVCLAVSAFLIFGIPMIALGPRAVLRNTRKNPEGAAFAASLVAIGVSLFLVSGSFIQTGTVDTLSAENFYSLYAQV
ncbi:MAG: hypothetical protein ABJG15_09605 [Hyphomonadaceae bacterium]